MNDVHEAIDFAPQLVGFAAVGLGAGTFLGGLFLLAAVLGGGLLALPGHLRLLALVFQGGLAPLGLGLLRLRRLFTLGSVADVLQHAAEIVGHLPQGCGEASHLVLAVHGDRPVKVPPAMAWAKEVALASGPVME